MLSSVAIVLLTCAAADKATGDLKKMAGTWEARRYLADGNGGYALAANRQQRHA